MIRVVFEHAPNLFGLTMMDETELALTVTAPDGSTYYRAEFKNHYVLYRRAVSGWGAVPGQTPDARQQ